MQSRDLRSKHVPRLLVVDSDPGVTSMMCDNFAVDGYTVDVLTQGDDIYNLDLSLYDLVLIDLSIDNYNGLGHVEQIKQI